QPLDAPLLLNVNIPAVPYDAIDGMRVTRLGKRHPSQPVVKSTTPYGEPVYWIGPVGSVSDAAPDTDFGAVKELAVSITPLRFDLTHHEQLQDIQRWAAPLCVSP
ncbi:MAG TPA: 5'/3'-nucleotidase SurE, partial [Burkholderiaceae bacterium]|nr:5'/3'-nucleotidase SurE [Burkholderiaceae bacterium]